jgi:hypothetical protein
VNINEVGRFPRFGINQPQLAKELQSYERTISELKEELTGRVSLGVFPFGAQYFLDALANNLRSLWASTTSG